MPHSCKYRFITMQRTQDRNIKCIKWHSVYSGNQEYYPAFSQLIFQLSCFFYPTFKNGPYYKLNQKALLLHRHEKCINQIHNNYQFCPCQEMGWSGASGRMNIQQYRRFPHSLNNPWGCKLFSVHSCKVDNGFGLSLTNRYRFHILSIFLQQPFFQKWMVI